VVALRLLRTRDAPDDPNLAHDTHDTDQLAMPNEH